VLVFLSVCLSVQTLALLLVTSLLMSPHPSSEISSGDPQVLGFPQNYRAGATHSDQSIVYGGLSDMTYILGRF
jgi:hypothetical protein